MNVENIRLINIRNYKDINLDFNKNINIFIGKNAQGKTNLVEAIYMCATGRSFRTNKDKEIINISKDEAYIGTNIRLGNYEKFIEIKMQKDKPKRIRINKTELKNLKELDSGLYVVLFSPDDLRIIKDGPQERRNFLDNSISQIRPVYNYNLNRYKKILMQRNNLLKSSKFKKDVPNLLDLFDVQIAKIGTSILLERQRYIKYLETIAKNVHSKITNDIEELSLYYLTNIPMVDDKKKLEERYIDLLKKNMGRDLEYGTTEIGPHRDDILFSINKKDCKTYGSQGQQRTVVLSLILSEVEMIKEEVGMYPVLLLDDVFSELDEGRREYLVKFFKDMQVFITLTNSENLKSMENIDKTIFEIEDGKLKLES